MSILQISGLTHIFDSKTLFREAELSINNGEHCGIVGLNGAGKTTLIKLAVGLLTPGAGQVLFDGQPIDTKSKEAIAYLPTRTNLPR